MRSNKEDAMRNDFESNYLAHHGILGQKWGQKNGPPYPLGASDHSDSEKKAGWRKSIQGKIQNIRRKSKKFQKDQDSYNKSKTLVERFKNLNKLEEKQLSKKGIPINDDERKEIANLKKSIEFNKKAINENQKICDSLVKKYGDMEVTDAKFQEAIKRSKEKTDEFIAEIDKHDKEIASSITSNKKEIANSMAKEMTSDIKRWVKQGDISMPKSLAGKSDSEIEKQIAKKIEKNIANYYRDNVFEFGNDVVNFNIAGISEYSDSQPLSIDYDVKNKKIKDFYYL